MKKICIFGTGGFAKEVYWLARQCGREVDAFIDIEQKNIVAAQKLERKLF